MPKEAHEVLPRPDIMPLLGCHRAALLVRHSERYGGDVADVKDGLTSSGIEMARKLGIRLKGMNLRLYSSPMQRCMDTARLIGEGAGSRAQVTVTRHLGLPGPFMLDDNEVDRLLAIHGRRGFIAEWFNGAIPPQVMLPYGSGSEAFMAWVCENMRSMDEGIDIYVSHDLYLTPVLVHYLNYDIDKNGVLGFLDGFCVVTDGGDVRLSYLGESTNINGSKRGPR